MRNRRARWRISSRPPSALGLPLIYLQDVSGFMVGPEAEREGIIRAGAEMVETMACATVPKIVAHAQSRQRRGLLRHGGSGLRPELHVQLAHRAHRRDGGRFGRGGAVLGGAGEAQGRSAARGSARAGRAHPRATTSAGWTRATPPRAATATPSSIRWRPAAFLPSRWRHAMQHATGRSGIGAIMIRIANGQGFWGDWLEAPVRLVEQGPHRLSRARLPGRGHHVDPAEAEAGRSRLWATRAISRRWWRASRRRSASAASR